MININLNLMKKLILFVIILHISINVISQGSDFYHLKIKDINGEVFDFNKLAGKKIIIVNTASQCMYTPQYKALQKLYNKYKVDGLEIIAFPCNDFANREPGSNKEIAEFCTEKYSVTFPIMSKIHVKGDNIHPVYQYLTQKEKNGFADSEVRWNFQKYLINEEGKIEKIIKPRKRPYSSKIISWIEGK